MRYSNFNLTYGYIQFQIHLCGEPAAIDIVKKLLEPIGETVEVRYYERKSPLAIADKAIESYSNVSF